MISINNLSYFLGDRVIYENASLHINSKQKIGLIGLNGAGKSTLLKIITGELTPDGGNISKAGDCSLGFLNQDLLSYQTDDSILAVAMTAFEEQNRLQVRIDKILHEMETDYKDELVDKLAKVQEEFEALNGYTIQSQAEAVLEGLGFTTDELHKPLREFSGGWRMRVMLAKLLLQHPSLLMLDEPTNHLDLPSIEWVEKYIQAYDGAVIVVSHDREFLDNVADTTVEVFGGKLNLYPGNYSFYLEEKKLRNEIQKGAYENQQAKIRQTERFIERFKAKASKARQVQSRVRSLEKMEVVDEVMNEAAKVHFRFQFATQPGRHILRLENVTKRYHEKVVLNHTNISMERGDKIALIGANGMGKSTALRVVAGTEPIEGKRALGHNVIFTFYAQHQLESLKLEHTLLDELKYANPQKTEAELRIILGCFLFSGEDVFKKIKVLSGGEKSRVALAKVLLSQANFLLLDEPTNHLDMQSVNILIQALRQYEGSFIVVSHDRYFVESIANKIWYIEGKQIKEYPGTYHEYMIWKEEKLHREKDLSEATKPSISLKNSTNKNTSKVPEAPKEVGQVELQRKISFLEAHISILEKEKHDLELKMSGLQAPNGQNITENLLNQYQEVLSQLEMNTKSWEDLMLAAEQAPS